MLGTSQVAGGSCGVFIRDHRKFIVAAELKLVERFPGGFEAEAEIPSQRALEERHSAVLLRVIGNRDIGLNALSYPFGVGEVAQTPDVAIVHLEAELVGILSDPVAELVAQVFVARQVVPVLVVPRVNAGVLERHIEIWKKEVEVSRAQREGQPLVIEAAVKEVAEVDHIDVGGAVEEEILREAHLEVGEDHPVPVVGGNSSRVVVHHLVVEEGDEGFEAEIRTVNEGVAEGEIELVEDRERSEVGDNILVFIGHNAARTHAFGVRPEGVCRVVNQRIDPALEVVESEPANGVGVKADLRERRRLR